MLLSRALSRRRLAGRPLVETRSRERADAPRPPRADGALAPSPHPRRARRPRRAIPPRQRRAGPGVSGMLTRRPRVPDPGRSNASSASTAWIGPRPPTPARPHGPDQAQAGTGATRVDGGQWSSFPQPKFRGSSTTQVSHTRFRCLSPAPPVPMKPLILGIPCKEHASR
jgi:hypothetical protein